MKFVRLLPPTLMAMSLASSPAVSENISLGSVFSSNQSNAQSFLRFYNVDETPGTATVTLRNSTTGDVLGRWTTPDVPESAMSQFQITIPESEADAVFEKPDFYTIVVEPSFNGAFQHVLWKPSNGTLTNLSTCAGNVSAETTSVIAYHTSILDDGYPSTLAVTNAGVTAATADLVVYNARDGVALGTYTTASIPPGGQILLTTTEIEERIGTTPASNTFHYNIVVESAFNGHLQHLVDNQEAGVITDMTALCTLTANADTESSVFEGVVSGGNDEGGALTVTVEADVTVPESSTSSSFSASAESGESFRQFERPQAVVSASGTYTPDGESAVALSGTYDTATRSVSVSGSGYQFDGSVDVDNGSQRLSGTYSGPTSTGGYAASRSKPTNRVVRKYCGNWSGTVDGGFVEGTWNFSIFNSGSISGRTANKVDGDNQNMTGSATVNRASGQTTDGTTWQGNFSGRNRQNFSGTFNSEGDTGELTGRVCS